MSASDDEHVIALAGELDLDGAERVTQELQRAEATDARRIVLDLSSLEFIDSSGIRLIIAADARSRMDGDRLVLIRGPQAGAARVRADGDRRTADVRGLSSVR